MPAGIILHNTKIATNRVPSCVEGRRGRIRALGPAAAARQSRLVAG
jgi:hypothetical protein